MSEKEYEQYRSRRNAFWRSFFLDRFFAEKREEVVDFFGSRLEEYLATGELLYRNGDYRFAEQRRKRKQPYTIKDYVQQDQAAAYAGSLIRAMKADNYRMLLRPGESLPTYVAELVMRQPAYGWFLQEIPAGFRPQAKQYLFARIEQAKQRLSAKVCGWLQERYPRSELLRRMQANESYKRVLRGTEEEQRRKAGLLEQMTAMAPIDPRLLYLEAMRMERRVILHVGGTNAGKSFEAIRALAGAKRGVYLAPLRLLAYEVYDTLTKEGVRCAMVTGEERILPEGKATHVSSTIEMLDLSKEYDVAVIDEAQMISDKGRGGAWTRAVLGVRAREIHVCAAPYAEGLLVSLFASCGSEVQVVRHERKVPLVVEREEFSFPESVREGDACIVFSRRDALAAAAELQEKNVPCSIIYGAMPYDVRHAEMARFAAGKGRARTRVIVATDAIGMGLNVPIRRVVFLSVEKYDGFTERRLRPEEIQQIAGRAGRFGMYDVGLVTSWGRRRFIREGLSAKCEELTEAVLPFPAEVIDCDAPLSELLALWSENPVEPPYVKASVEHELKLCRYMEKLTDRKQMIYRYITLPFDEDSEVLFELWASLLRAELEERHKRIRLASYIPEYPERIVSEAELKKCEVAYQACDLLYQWADKAGFEGDTGVLARKRAGISQEIMRFLRQQKLRARTCRVCGAKLPFGYRYSVCENCNASRY